MRSPRTAVPFRLLPGTDAPETYLARSPRSGELHVIDTATRKVVDRRVLGNQPTALAVHPSGRYLTVSNFWDNNIELYRIDGETGANP